jgi:hypothetical protein
MNSILWSIIINKLTGAIFLVLYWSHINAVPQPPLQSTSPEAEFMNAHNLESSPDLMFLYGVQTIGKGGKRLREFEEIKSPGKAVE